MNIKKKKYIFFGGLFSLAFIINIIGVLIKSTPITSVTTPLVFISLILLYVGTVNKINFYVVLLLFFCLLSEIFFIFKGEYFIYTLLASITWQIIVIYFIFSFKHIKYKDILPYFIPTIIGYFILYGFVINELQKSIVFIIFIWVNSILVSSTMANYLKKMYWANYLLFLGIAFKVLSYAITSIDIFNARSNVFSLLTNVISDLFICVSFIVRVNKPKKE